MSDKLRKFMRPTLMLPLLICLIGTVTAGASIAVLFSAAIDEEKNRLQQMVLSQAHLMEAMATVHTLRDKHVNAADVTDASMEQILTAHHKLNGFGETGEFIIGKLMNGQVFILMSPRFEGDINFQVPDQVPVPMQKALAGESGYIVAPDYKGNSVLAYYVPINSLKIGLVGKIDEAEVYRPFIVSSAIVAAMAVGLLILGVYASRLFSVPYRLLEREKKRAEEYLNIAGTMIVALDSHGIVTLINSKGSEVLGYDIAEIVGKNWFEMFIPKNIRADVEKAFASIIAGSLQPVEQFENAVLARSGEELLIAWHNTFVKDDKGRIIGCLSAGENITNRKRAEDALRISETRFNQSQEFANIGTWDWNIQTGELYWSPRIAPLFGYAKGELETTYDNFLAAIHIDDRQAVIDAVNACVANGAEYNIEHRVVWPDGTVRWLLEKGDVVRDDAGAPLNMLGVVQDITARKWAESEVLRLSRRNELILNAAGDGIYGIDLDGRGTFANPATMAMLGYEAGELIGRDLHKVIHHTTALGEPYLEEQCPIYMAFRDGKVRTISDEVFWRKDGTSITVEYTSTPIVEGDVIKGAVVVFRDVSERKKLQAQLIQSSKMATLGEMATGIAHELNQPLNVISMATNNIKNRLERGTAELGYLRDKLDKVILQVERAAAIIDHMRIFGRTASNDVSLLDPVKMVEGSLGLIGEQLRLANIEVMLEGEANRSLIRGHQVQVEQVMLNLLANAHDALKAKDGEAKRIVLRIGEDAPAKQVRIEVEDNGGGIATQHLTRIFEPFYTTKEVGKGTGLGLSISYGIITEMGGTLAVHNAEQGACFTISLPSCARNATG